MACFLDVRVIKNLLATLQVHTVYTILIVSAFSILDCIRALGSSEASSSLSSRSSFVWVSAMNYGVFLKRARNEKSAGHLLDRLNQ